MSSLRRGHANLLCIVPILADDLFRGSNKSASVLYITRFYRAIKLLWVQMTFGKEKLVRLMTDTKIFVPKTVTGTKMF